MAAQFFRSQQVERTFFAILLSLTLLNLVSCGPEPQIVEAEPGQTVYNWATVTPAISAEDVNPTAIEPIQAGLELVNQTTIQAVQTLTDTEPVELPVVRLPMRHVDALREAALANDIEFAPPARENTLIYALPRDEGGLVFMLTPPQYPPGFSTKELAADPAWFSDQMLGGLSVVRQVNNSLPALPPGDYVITLSTDGSQVVFSNRERVKFSFPAVIRYLPRYASEFRPFAVVTTQEMCLSWFVSQVCADVKTPLPSNLTQDLQQAASRLLGQNGEQFFTFNMSLPDIAGVSALQRCENALNPFSESGTPAPPNYAGCWATMTTVPAVGEGFPTPSALREEPGTVSTFGISLFAVLEPLEETVFCNDPRKVLATGECIEYNEPPVLGQVAPSQVPSGEYLVYHVKSETDPEVTEGITATRIVLFTLPYISYVMPSFDGVPVIGSTVPGQSPPETDGLTITANVRNRVCMFWECRWLSRRGGWWRRWWR